MSPTRPAEIARRDGAQDILPGLRQILATASVRACHNAMVQAARLLEGEFGFSILTVAEFASGSVIAWQSDGPLRDNAPALRAWSQRASQYPGRCLAFGDAAAGVLMPSTNDFQGPMVALVADGTLLPPQLECAMRDVAEFAARHLHHLRMAEENLRRRQRLDVEGVRDAALVRASADLVWEAGSDGIIHVTHTFHDRRDLARLFEGRALCDIPAGARNLQVSAEKGLMLRWQRITLPDLEEPLFLTACPSPGATAPFPLRGIIAAAPDDTADRRAIDVRTLETILASRHREEQLRRETEIMMLGLRILLSDVSFREKLEQLARHLAAAIDCDEARLVLLRPGEKPSLILPETVAADPEALRQIETLAGPRPFTLLPAADAGNVRLGKTLAMRGGDIVMITFASTAENYYLLCRARRSPTANDHGIAERVSLLLQQALLLQQDQKQMIHTAKLSALGQMSTGIAHELRQPLNAISLAAQNIDLMVGLGKAGPDLLKEKTERILGQIERACKVMDRMRRFGRKTAGDYKPASLAAIARSARSLMDPLIQSSGIIVGIDIPDDLKAMVDELEIEQVLVNLIQNAADALEARKGGRIRIWSADDPNDRSVLRLQVEDNGPGFPAHVIGHAMDAFFTTKPEGKGTGLGLSIAHTILREHGGRILVDNGETGGGRITLVMRRPEAQILAFPPREPGLETAP
jgi:signal transduction histidine kinase